MQGPETIRIRRGVLADAAARCFTETFAADNRPEDLRAFLAEAYGEPQQSVELCDPRVSTLLAHEDESLVGYAQLRPRSPPPAVTLERPLELHRFYVARAAQGRGIAQRLMGATLAAARAAGAASLWLGVWERNARAMAFYRKAGFDDAGIGIDFHVGADRQVDRVYAIARL